MSSVKVQRKQAVKEEQSASYSEDRSSETHDSSDSNKSGSDGSRKERRGAFSYWPIIVFVIIFIIILVSIFACGGHAAACGTGTTGTLFGGLFLVFILWILVLWFFCSSGSQTAAWFFVILIFAIIISLFIASFLGSCGHDKSSAKMTGFW